MEKVEAVICLISEIRSACRVHHREWSLLSRGWLGEAEPASQSMRTDPKSSVSVSSPGDIHPAGAPQGKESSGSELV